MTSVLDASTVGTSKGWFEPPGATVGAQQARTATQAAEGNMVVDIREAGGNRSITTIRFPRDVRFNAQQADTLMAFLMRLNTLLRAPHDDEDFVLTSVVQTVAETFVMVVPHCGAEPIVQPLGDGGVGVHWDRDRGSLDIEFDSDGDAVALIVDRTCEPPTRRAGYLAAMWDDVLRWFFQV